MNVTAAGVGWAIALWLMLCTARASAEVRLDWQPAEGCPDAATVTQALHAWLDATGTPLVAAKVEIVADVERSASGYELALELRTRSGARRVRMFSESCEVFAQAVAVQASLLIASDEAERPEPELQPHWPQRAFTLRAQGLFVSSPLPAPTFGLSLAAAYVMLPWRVELAGGYLFARDLRYDEHPNAGGRLSAGFLSIRPCAVMQLGRVELAGCTGAEAGLISGKGVGVSGARASVRRWFAVLLGTSLDVFVTPTWSVWLGVDLLTSLTRPEFYVARLGMLYRPERFGVQAALGMEMHIW